MEFWKKITAGTLVGGAIVGGIIFIPKLIKLKNIAPELDVIPKAQIFKVDLKGITIRIDVQLKNPTSAAFKMKYPYIRLSYNGAALGTSQSVDKDIEMPGFGEANITQIMLTIPLLSLLSSAGTLLKAVKGGQEVSMDITTMTHIDPYWNYDSATKKWTQLFNLGKKSLIPYTKTQKVTLRKQK